MKVHGLYRAHCITYGVIFHTMAADMDPIGIIETVQVHGIEFI